MSLEDFNRREAHLRRKGEKLRIRTGLSMATTGAYGLISAAVLPMIIEQKPVQWVALGLGALCIIGVLYFSPLGADVDE